MRLIDCWCPEPSEPFGMKAKADLTEVAEFKDGVLHIPTQGANDVGDIWSFGRVLGRVWIDGLQHDLSEYQVQLGNAARKRSEYPPKRR